MSENYFDGNLKETCIIKRLEFLKNEIAKIDLYAKNTRQIYRDNLQEYWNRIIGDKLHLYKPIPDKTIFIMKKLCLDGEVKNELTLFKSIGITLWRDYPVLLYYVNKLKSGRWGKTVWQSNILDIIDDISPVND